MGDRRKRWVMSPSTQAAVKAAAIVVTSGRSCIARYTKDVRGCVAVAWVPCARLRRGARGREPDAAQPRIASGSLGRHAVLDRLLRGRGFGRVRRGLGR